MQSHRGWRCVILPAALFVHGTRVHSQISVERKQHRHGMLGNLLRTVFADRADLNIAAARFFQVHEVIAGGIDGGTECIFAQRLFREDHRLPLGMG